MVSKAYFKTADNFRKNPVAKFVSIFLMIIISFLYATHSNGYQTYAGSKKLKKSDPLRIFLEGQVPPNPDDYTWQLYIPETNGKPAPTGIPVYQKSEFTGTTMIGTVPPGAIITLSKFSAFNSSNLFQIPKPSNFQPIKSQVKPAKQPRKNNGAQDFVWVPGRFIKATAYNGK